MKQLTAYLHVLFVLFGLAACGDAPSVTAPEKTLASYDDTLYCFNGRSIVHAEGFAGLIDDSGRLLLAPEWDSIEFLDDETALLQKNDRWFLTTRDGRVFAESEEPAGLENNFRELSDAMHDADIRRWDAVLDNLDALCSSCLRLGRRAPDEETLALYSAFKEQLGQACAPMTSSQQNRFEEIVRRFNTFSRR